MRVLQVKAAEVPQGLIAALGDRQEANMLFGRLVLDLMDQGQPAADAKRQVASEWAEMLDELEGTDDS